MERKEAVTGMQKGDMIVNLADIPEVPSTEGVFLKRAMICDMPEILAWVREELDSAAWVSECEKAILQGTCFIAAAAGKILGFACYDATALDYFGPIGIAPSSRGTGIGRALLLRTLHAMREKGYAYAIIGWVGDAAGFYERTAGASYIPGGIPSHSAYRDMIRFS